MSIVSRFVFRWRQVADRFEQPAVVEPVDPFEHRVLDGIDVAPGPAPADDLGLEEADHRLGERVVVGVADAADGAFNASLSEGSV